MPQRIPLIKGYQAFRATDFGAQRQLYEILGTKGQNPDILIISCADSRVDPTDIFHAYPGEMFVVRNVAAMIPPHGDCGDYGTAAAIEYGVRALGVKGIVVMGHESCGGCAGALHGTDGMDNAYIDRWLGHLAPAAEAVRASSTDEPERKMERETVRLSLQNLATYPFVKEKVDAGELQLIGAWFSIVSAKLMLLGEDGVFAEVPTGVASEV